MQANNFKRLNMQILNFLIRFLSRFTKDKKKTRAILYRMWESSVKRYINTKEWLDANNLSSNYKIIKNPERINLKEFMHVEENSELIFQVNLTKIDLGEVFLSVLPNARYIPEWSSYITADNILLNDLSLEFGVQSDLTGFQHTVFKNLLPNETYIDQNIAILDSAGSKNYFHWCINILPKIEFFEQSGIEIDKYLVDISRPFQVDSLKRIGFPMDKILPLSDVKNICAKNIIALSIPTVSCANLSSLEFLRNRLKIQNNIRDKRIFISRKKAFQGRCITNEDEIMEKLSPLGFKDYILEDMSLDEQIQVFSEAQTIISPHGAGLTNILFAGENTNIVEMFNPNYRVPCYCFLANSLNHNYYYIKGEGIEASNAHSDCSGNITIDINKIKKIINLLNLDKVNI